MQANVSYLYSIISQNLTDLLVNLAILEQRRKAK